MSKSAQGHETVPISEFKARCLEMLESLRHGGHDLVITKRGEPIAKVVPIRGAPRTLRGLLRGELEIVGDIVHVDLSDAWEVGG